MSTIGDAELREALAEYSLTLEFLQQQTSYVRLITTSRLNVLSFPEVSLAYDPNSRRERRFAIDFDIVAKNSQFLEYILDINNTHRAMAEWCRDTHESAVALCHETARLTDRECSTALDTVE